MKAQLTWRISKACILAGMFGACSRLETAVTAPERSPQVYKVEEKSVSTLLADLAARRVSSAQLVALYRARIEALDTNGPALHSVIAINPRAEEQARTLDEERATGDLRGPLHGIPILIKDNNETADPLPTTAGSLALRLNITGRDAPAVARLRAAGAIILGKANLSEWANIRSPRSSSGWSAIGGLTKNPYALERNPCGSSSGSGAAIAANLAALAVGTETDGSITCPASLMALVGLKPTVGLVSRTHIIPISPLQDTAGPLTRNVADAALLLRVMAGSDPADAATRDADAHVVDYPAALSKAALSGRRFGVLKFHAGFLPEVDTLFEAAIAELKAAGAELAVIEKFAALEAINDDELKVLLGDFRRGVNDYLAGSPAALEVRTLADLIRFNENHAREEMPHFHQEFFEQAEDSRHANPAEFSQLREHNRKRAQEALDGMLKSQSLDALIAPSYGPAWTTDLINGDHVLGGACTLPAVAGYPHITVPMGQVHDLPIGLSFIGPAWSDATLLNYAYAYEQRTQLRRPPTLPNANAPQPRSSQRQR